MTVSNREVLRAPHPQVLEVLDPRVVNGRNSGDPLNPKPRSGRGVTQESLNAMTPRLCLGSLESTHHGGTGVV